MSIEGRKEADIQERDNQRLRRLGSIEGRKRCQQSFLQQVTALASEYRGQKEGEQPRA